MATCARCGTDLPPDAAFCPQCRLAVAVPAPAVDEVEVAGIGGTISGRKTVAKVTVPTEGRLLREGERFHKYTVVRLLGAGAMGVVYVATEQPSGQPVALKLINPALADKPMARERFVREGVTARNVRHPNVVAMYDVGEVDGQLYLAMEYVAGETLRKWLRRALQERRDVAFETARGIIRAVLEGLEAAHVAGVVHRDLKPENIMLLGDPHAGDYRLKILDFGIAREIGAVSHLTTGSSSTGTPLYMAPEQKTAAESVGPPADLYAVTAMLYELLIGVAPEGRWGSPSRERPDLPAGIEAIIETGLASRPRSRYQAAGEYLRALEAVKERSEIPRVPEPPALREPPPELPPPKPPATSPWERLVQQSRAQSPGSWALWDRMSKTQRILFVVVTVIVFSVLAMYCEGQQPAG